MNSEIADTNTDYLENRDVIMEVQDLNVFFDMDRGRLRILRGIDMDIYRGEILAVVGESGSGKSMFASALLDVVEDPGEPTGEITYYSEDGDTVDVLEMGKSEAKHFRWEDVAMVFQGAMNSFNPTMKIRGHFEETIVAHNADLDERLDFVRDLFEALNLDPQRILTSYPHELSGGMKQRTLIALSLVLEPDVLVMDEPTAALDLLMQRAIINMLKDLRDTFDLTIMFITHDLPLVSGLSDRIGVMYAGEIVELGPTVPLLQNARHPYTRSLLRSVPAIDSNVDEMQVIEGSSPDPVNVPSGCSYHPRCPLADESCKNEDPGLDLVSDNHNVACFYPEESTEAIQYTLHGSTGGEY
jgi:peptide/nickel transport system ATP-binding protein